MSGGRSEDPPPTENHPGRWCVDLVMFHEEMNEECVLMESDECYEDLDSGVIVLTLGESVPLMTANVTCDQT